MDVKEKLVELLTGYSIDTKSDVEYVVDHLIAHGVTVQEWISVKDRLPEANVGVSVYAPRLKNIFEVFYKGDGKWEIVSYRGGEILNDDVTHWMPLPQPPVDMSRMFENVSADDLRAYREKT